jgi:hypothetical protein
MLSSQRENNGEVFSRRENNGGQKQKKKMYCECTESLL